MENPKKTIPNLAVASLLLASIVVISILECIFYLHHLLPPPFPLSDVEDDVAVDGDLDAALRLAATAEGTVIVAVVNRAYVEQNDVAGGGPTMLDLFLESFWVGEGTRGLLQHVLFVAVDRTAYDRCRFRRLNCFRLSTGGVDLGGEKMYMSEDFIKMMWRRTRFLLEVLRNGYNFIFTDTDVMWLRNPFLRLSSDSNEDLQFSTDWFNGDSWSTNNSINTGFYFTRSNNKTIALFERWLASKDTYPDMKEQDVLIKLVRNGIFQDMGLKVRFLETLYFSGFCRDSKDIKKVTTVHANCCVSIRAKLTDLSNIMHAWKSFRQQPKEHLMATSREDLGFNVTTQRVPWFRNHTACYKILKAGSIE